MTTACWICGLPADSAEHRLKRSDAKATFGVLTQDRPVFLHTEEARNQRVQTLRSALLSFECKLCTKCNNALTQPYDIAWERLSAALRERTPVLRSGGFVRTNRIFRYNTRKHMRNVQLFFVKLFLGMIADGGVPIPVEPFQKALRSGQFHRGVYLKLGLLAGYEGKPVAGASDLLCAPVQADGFTRYATWLYEPGSGIAVMVTYAAEGEKRVGLEGAWHPRLPTTRLAVDDFND